MRALGYLGCAEWSAIVVAFLFDDPGLWGGIG